MARVGARPGASTPDAADLLSQITASRALPVPRDLVSGIAAGATTRWQINAAQTLVVSNTSREAFIDDAFDCGRIAATAALSAIHATAAAPLFARLTCACPDGASDTARQALIEGVAVAMSEAGAVLADAEFVEAPVLRFDVLVAGVVRPDRIRSASGARPDDLLILANRLGIGICAAALASGRLSAADRPSLIAEATRTNRVGIALGAIRNVHAIAEVGPAGLLAAALALARESSCTAVIESAHVPAMPQALALARAGCVAPQSSRNWNRDGAQVDLADAVMPEMRNLLTDPHASGALLIACKAESAQRILELCTADGHRPAIVGRLRAVTAASEVAGRSRRLTVA